MQIAMNVSKVPLRDLNNFCLENDCEIEITQNKVEIVLLEAHKNEV